MSAPTAPALSLILVCKNPGTRLIATLDSIAQQRHIEPEVIVVDGGSTDGTREWLEERRSQFAALIAEPDSGLAEAKNKGLALAHGDWVMFLSAGDRLVGEHILSEVLNWARKTEAGLVVGEVAYDDGRIHRLRTHFNPLAGNFVRPPGAFYRRALFIEGGGFDPTLALQSDYDLHLRLWKGHVRFKPIPLRLAACATPGRSARGHWQVYREEIAVRHRYAAAWRCWRWDALSVLRFLGQRPFHLGTTSP